ncbi:hypothetical protein ABC973_08070 [Capnocytophaga sputigena]|uniref:hypothetical protein n=1 Tax=Capnocytophaga sputigena TaxID=1019 RepID=UPI0031F53AD8
MDNLGDIQWIFRKTANIADMTTLKNGVLQALKKADGKPIEELGNISLDQVKNSLKMKQKLSIKKIELNFF